MHRCRQVKRRRAHFNRQHAASFLQKQFRQRAEAGANFENFIRRRNFRRVHDAAELVAVVQKILAERPRQLDVALRQYLAHFVQIHWEFIRGLKHP